METSLQEVRPSNDALVIAWTAAQGNGKNVHVLVGARTLPQIEENVGGGTLSLEEADIVSMQKDVEQIMA